ncbi:MAG: FeoA family protein [Candidatus Thorarchaeota archaeon]
MIDDVVPDLEDNKPKKLVSVSPGTKCILLGVEGIRPSRHIPRSGKRRRKLIHRSESRSDEDCRFRQSQKEKGRGLMRRLLDLGITKGCTFTVVQGGGHGPVLIEVRGTRIALGHHMACRILVKEVP